MTRRKIPAAVRRAVFANAGLRCQIGLVGCTVEATEIDHIVPVAYGGTNEISNLRASCRSCNRRRPNPANRPKPPPRMGDVSP